MTVLVFSRTTGFRHDSITAGVNALREMSVDLVSTEDSAVFDEPLHGFAALVFLNTSGDVFTGPQRTAFESYVVGGGGFVGVHCAAATETGWPFFRSLIGASFTGHPDVQPARVIVADPDHPTTGMLPPVWERTDEWYDFEAPATDRVLLRVDEASYTGGTTGADHPLAWCHERLGGRAFYTALGHTVESYAEPLLRAHLLAAITWAASPDLG